MQTPAPALPAPAPSRGQTLTLASMTLAMVAVAGLLRSFHDAVPRGPAALGPFASLLFPVLVALSALHLTHRHRARDRRGRDRLSGYERPGAGLTLAQVTPLLIAVLGEKWLTTELLGSAFDWIDFGDRNAALADAVYRLWTGLGLLAAGLAMIPLLRQIRPRLLKYTKSVRLRAAALNAGAALALMGGSLAALAAATGSHWVVNTGRVLAVAAGAQVVRGIAEELFYRGLLQTALVRLLIEAGLPDRRRARILAVLATSAGFALEHVAPGVSPRTWTAVFLLSIMLGLLLEVSRNLYLAMAAHTVFNLLYIGALPLPFGPAGLPLVTPLVAGLMFFALLFVGVVIAHGRHRTA